MLRRSAWFFLLGAGAFLPLIGCGGERATAEKAENAERAESSHSEREKTGSFPEAPEREVRVARAETAKLARTVAVAGTLAADEQVALGMKVAGRLGTIAVDLGTPVQRGQVIARLDPTDFELRVRQAESALEQARVRLGLPPTGSSDAVDDLEKTSGVRQARALLEQARVTRERERSLFEQQLIPRSELDNAEASLLVAEARHQDALEESRNRVGVLAQRRSELDIARQQLKDSTLTAPWDGAIRERRAAPGDYIAAGQTVAILVRIHPLRLRLPVPEREAVGLKVGQEVHLKVEGDPAEYQGRLARLSPAISEDSRTLSVEAEVPNRDGRLKPGSFARAEIIVRSGEPAVLVPASSIVTFAGVDKVIGVEGDHAQEKPIKRGRRSGDQVEVLAGVKPGEPVVVEPGNLVSGERVRVVR
ncbi:MAG TPA: efflux RND transporter periplasmic adaptor subunit [Thermoanaerobaculia bacterium]|nr:efflux RND transporter periplasmic adaptor subunit [Thermoanaerobaculia bacterium]